MIIIMSGIPAPELPDEDEWKEIQVFTGNATFTNFVFPMIRADYNHDLIGNLVTVQPMTTPNSNIFYQTINTSTATNTTFTYTTTTDNTDNGITVTAA